MRNIKTYERSDGILKPGIEGTDSRFAETERFVAAGSDAFIKDEGNTVKEKSKQKTNSVYSPVSKTQEYVPRL